MARDLEPSAEAGPPGESGNGDALSELAVPNKLQALKDYRLVIEYKHMRQHAPGGVFVIPSVNHLRLWYGVIFVRRGHYANGTFKFRVELPPEYNDVGTWPRLIFSSQVFNPLVDSRTGELDLHAFFPEWNPGKHYLVNALTYLKKVFYMKDFDAFPSPPNPEAASLFKSDKRGFLDRVEACVRASQEAVYENDPGSSLRFTEPKPAHETLRERILGPEAPAGEGVGHGVLEEGTGNQMGEAGPGRGGVDGGGRAGGGGGVLDEVRQAAAADGEPPQGQAATS